MMSMEARNCDPLERDAQGSNFRPRPVKRHVGTVAGAHDIHYLLICGQEKLSQRYTQGVGYFFH